MARFFKISLLLFLLVGLLHNTLGNSEDKKKGLTKKVLDKLGKMSGIIGQAIELYETFESLYSIFEPQDEVESTDDRLDQINDKLNQLSSDLRAFETRLDSRLERMEKSNILVGALKDVFTYMRYVDDIYKRFSDYTNDTLTFADSDLEYIVKLSHTKLEKYLINMHHAFQSTDESLLNIPMLLRDPSIVHEYMCKAHQSSQQTIHILYEKMMLTEVKAYAMSIYSNEYIKELNGMNNSSHNNQTINAARDRMGKTFKLAKKSMETASREIWTCDHSIYQEKGVHFARIGPVFQKYILPEREALHSTTLKEIGCDYTCPEIVHVKHKCEGGNCGSQHCHGEVRDCEVTGKEVEFCVSENDEYRRYDYITYGKKAFGDDENCSHNRVKKEGWTRFFDADYCDHCMCTCENNNSSIARYISLQPAFSNLRKKKVVIGVRMQLENNIFYIQIKQGKLLPNGRVEPDKNWKKIDYDFIKIGQEASKKDYYEITWDSKTVLLDEFDSSSDNYRQDRVLTGLQFQKNDGELGLTLRWSTFDFATGVFGDTSFEYPKLKAKNRKSISLWERDVPNNYLNNEERSGENEYIEFTTTDLTKDVGQNVIPFIDLQSVESYPPTPLSGAGIFLRSDNKGESGGYLAFKIFTLDVTRYMRKIKLKKHN